MASKQTYECYVCKRNGFENVRVYLDGKTENGKTIYKNEDMSPHSHKQKQQSGTIAATVNNIDLVKQVHHLNIEVQMIKAVSTIIDKKLDKLIGLLGDTKTLEQQITSSRGGEPPN